MKNINIKNYINNVININTQISLKYGLKINNNDIELEKNIMNYHDTKDVVVSGT